MIFQNVQNSFVLSALNAILLLCSLRQFMKNNAVACMSTFLSKNRKLRLAYPQYNGLTIIIAETPNATDIFLLPHISSLHCTIRNCPYRRTLSKTLFLMPSKDHAH